MTQEDVLQLILDGQRTTGAKVDHMTVAVGKLEQRVDGWERTSEKAQGVHDRCREEVDRKLTAHATENTAAHDKLSDRIDPIETLHDQQSGGAKTANLIWKIVSGVLGAVVMILGIIGWTGGVS